MKETVYTKILRRQIELGYMSFSDIEDSLYENKKPAANENYKIITFLKSKITTNYDSLPNNSASTHNSDVNRTKKNFNESPNG